MGQLNGTAPAARGGACPRAPQLAPPDGVQALSPPQAETLHRLANNLAILSAALRVERRRVADPVARTALDGAVARIEAMAQVQRLIYGLPPEVRIDVTAFLRHLAPVIATSLGMGCGVRGAAVEASGRTAEGLAVAITELALNARKHAYGGGPGDGIEVRVAGTPEGWVRVAVRDWGRGTGAADGVAKPAARPKERPGSGPGAGGGLGLRLVAASVETLGGRVSSRVDGGLHVVIEVPPG